jgi:S-DNA-T family DNA segregation ATPase FtsK/SpoIIIE
MHKYAQLSGDELENHLSYYLVNSWSYSSVSCFCRNEKAFEMQYIYRERSRRSVSSIAGSAYHKALELYFRSFSDERQELVDLTTTAYDYIDNVPANDWKLSKRYPTVENALAEATKSVNSLLQNFTSELRVYLKDVKRIIDIEQRYEQWVTIDGVDIPLPLHLIIDLVVELNDGRIVIIDHKSKSAFTDPDEIALTHGKQAITYVIGWEAGNEGQKVSEVWFIENKISKNKDGSAQIRKHCIVMDDDTRRLYETLLYESVRRMLQAVSDPDYVYTINDTDYLADKPTLYDFWTRTLISEVDDFPQLPENKKPLIAKRLKKIKDSSLAMISPQIITTFRDKAASFITFDYSKTNMTNEERIEHLLRTFNISVQVAHKIDGFSCDTYLCEAAAGVKLDSIRRYSLDIANALDVASVRIPGELVIYHKKSYLAIEVNKARERNLLWDQRYADGYKIPLGLDNYNKKVIWNLDNHSTPHMLVCGATGSGKSVCIRSTIEFALVSGIKRIFIMDPKYEFTNYAGDERIKVLNEIHDIEMQMKSLVDNMNALVRSGRSHKTLIIFDEYADAISQARKGRELDIEGFREDGTIGVIGRDRSLGENLQILLQKGRSSGFRILAATQRASVKVINGDAKVNFPVLVCFRVPKAADSRVVIDEDGAEMLTGHGDGLIKSPEYNDTVVRFQGFLYDK